MYREQNVPSIALYKPLNYTLMNGHQQTKLGLLEIRLFYVRITPCAVNTVPDHLTLRNLRREIGVLLEINGVRVPSADTASVTLRRDRVDKDSSEVTYVSTDNIRVTGAIEFEVIEDENEMILCGSLERIEPTWSNGSSDNGNVHNHNQTNESRTGWTMGFYPANWSKFGTSSLAIEVYIAGCCSAVPVMLTKTIRVSPRRRASRNGLLDAIPEDEDAKQLKLQDSGQESDEYNRHMKVGPGYYSDMYYGDDGQLSWFNAGVRVGVGISLGICLGVGLSVGLLMHSYQATTRDFRRRFF